MKTVKERDDLDLLTLVCELHGRSIMHMTKELHDASVEARQELESRIVAYQNFIKAHVIKSVCPKCKNENYYWHSYYRECMNCGEEYFKGQTVL